MSNLEAGTAAAAVATSDPAASMPRSLFTRRTSDRLDRVRRYLGEPGGAPKPRIRGGKASQAVLEELGLRNNGEWPRYKPAYALISRRFAGFGWTGSPGGGRAWVTFENYPTVESLHPSLADLSIESLRTTVAPHAPPHLVVDLFAPNIQCRVAPLLRSGDGHNVKLGAELARALVDLPIAFPPLTVMEAVRHWWTKALAGHPSTIVTPVCPDYATQETDDPLCPRAYTFDGLGDGIGYVAERALAALPKLWAFFRTLTPAPDIRFIVAIGDEEADSAENRARVHVTRDEFRARLRRSQQAFRQACPQGMPVETPFITELDRERWEVLLRQARSSVALRNYGPFGLTEDDLEILAKARRPLYTRWYGEDVDARAILDRQAPEYMAATELFCERYPNVLVLGADATAMAPFVQGLGRTIKPVLYLRHVSY
jgi:hypothetical protein